MSTPQRRDALLTIAGLGGLAALFLVGVYWPGHRAALQLRSEIAESEQALAAVPLRAAELDALRRDIERRHEYLRRTAPRVPVEAGLPTVLAQVARLADRCGLKATRLEPLNPVVYESHRELPVRITLQGEFRQIAEFLRGLESADRLVTVVELTLRSETRGQGGAVSADVHFSVYAGRIGHVDFSEFDASLHAGPADKKSWDTSSLVAQESRL